MYFKIKYLSQSIGTSNSLCLFDVSIDFKVFGAFETEVLMLDLRKYQIYSALVITDFKDEADINIRDCLVHFGRLFEDCTCGVLLCLFSFVSHSHWKICYQQSYIRSTKKIFYF